jgi:outer membrane receptor protein involved in Fe transport
MKELKGFAPWAICTAIALGISVPATAAELEEITVTATKRTSGLQEIPMSISAISGESLERSGVADFTDIATTVPSVSFRSAGPGRTKLNVRGISAATGVAPTVSFYLDEMPVQTISSGSTTSFAQTIIDPKMFDLERVEVLRGPQGTLYGSSSMGGTIRLITRQPTVELFESSVGADVSSTTGGGTNFRLNGMVNAPISDSVALRVVASYTDNDGYFDRVSSGDGPTPAGELFATDVNTEETVSVRAALRWEINDNAYLQPSVFTQTTEMDGKPNFDGPVSDSAQIAPYDAAEPFDDEFTLLNLTYAHDFEAMSLLASFSQIDREFKNKEDITDGSVLIFDALGMLPGPGYSNELVDLDDQTFEVRLTSSSDSDLQWLIGYYNKDATADAGYRMAEGWTPLDVWDPAIACPDQPNCAGQDGVLDVYFNGLANTQKLQEYEESAFFGELTYNVNDSFSVTAGLRRLDYDFHSLEENWGFAFNGDLPRDQANVRDAVISDSDTQEKLTLTYRFGDDSQVYVTGATGTRPGAINRVIPRSTDPGEVIGFACNNDLIALGVDDPSGYSGDEVTSTEFGWKMLLRDSSVRFNGAVYDVKWDNIQQLVLTSAVCGNNFTGNLGEAGSTGLELELTAAINDRLMLSAGLGYVDAQFEETILSPDDVVIVEKGDLLADVPELTWNIGLEYTIPASSGEYYLLGSVNYVDETLEVPGRSDDDVSGSGIDSGNVRSDYTLVDLRAGYISESGWEVSVFVDNATDEEAIYGFNDAIAFAFSPADPTVRNRPRTLGVSALWRFD